MYGYKWGFSHNYTDQRNRFEVLNQSFLKIKDLLQEMKQTCFTKTLEEEMK